ncbi:MAG: hypothetical protein OEM62_03790 [Acidobacteriota bacterium]|nr:hypothetical protein [Acidobacteriota bacterium]
MKSDTAPSPPTPARARGLFIGAAFSLMAFYLVGAVFLDGFALDLGSINFPSLLYVIFVAFYMLFGGLAAALLALGTARHWGAQARADAFIAQWNAISERRFLIWTCAAAFGIPLLLRLGLMGGAPLTDDEGAYRFAAELLASGRLWVASPELKLFFDQNFIINDGRMYSAYFLGWPALLAPGVWVGATWIVNPICSALTVPPLFGALRYFAGPVWARAGVLLYLSAPFVQIAAATELSHTSCLMALTWCLWMYLRTRADDSSLRDHAGLALSFAIAFFIRPQSALPIGLPLLVAWVLTLPRLNAGVRRRTVLAFGLPAVTLAALFLGALWAQNGSPFRTGYVRSEQYLIENDFRFTSFRPQDLSTVPGFDFSLIGPAIARTASGMFRLNFDLFGWPSSFAFLLLAMPVLSGRARILWAMTASYLLLNLFQKDWGVDTFGPMHAFELALPILILTIVGAHNLSRWLSGAQAQSPDQASWRWSALSPALLAAAIATAWIGFVPVRLAAVRQIADHLNVALEAPKEANLSAAVVFSPWPFAPPCGGSPNHFVLFRPVNDPDLQADVLWVNHIDIEENRRLMETLPGRTGYVLRWTSECDVELLPLATLSPGDFPPGLERRPAGS